MRTFTKTINAYTYDELSEQSKERALDKYRQEQYEYGLDWLEEEMGEKLYDIMREYHMDVDPGQVQVRYDLSSCQGDGASFTGDFVWHDNDNTYSATVKTNAYGNHYSHSKSVYVSDLYKQLPDDEVEEASSDEYDALNELVYKIGDELERFGYKAIDDYLETENLEDMLRDDYLFTEDGFYFNQNGYTEV